MLTRVDVTTSRGSVLTLNVFADGSPYRINDVQGLDPVKASVVSTSYSGMEGEEFQAIKRTARNIVIGVDFVPDYTEGNTVSDLRTNLYSYFMPKESVSLRFYNSTGLYVDIQGYVETCEAPMFVQDPDATISIMCLKPDLIDPRTVEIDDVSVSTSAVLNIDYPGNIATGVLFTLLPMRSVPAFTIYNTGDDGILTQLDFNAPLISGDRLVINTFPGKKSIRLTRAGVESSYLYGRPSQSSWTQMMKGINRFRVYAPGDPIPYQLVYNVRYGGL